MSIASEITFMAGSLPRTPFRELVDAAAQAGFDSITLWPNIWRHAQDKGGLTLRNMRAILDDHGVKLDSVDVCTDWVSEQIGTEGFSTQSRVVSRRELLNVCAELGGTTLSAAHTSGAPLVIERDAEGFAKLCDDAAAHGLRVCLEAVSFSAIPHIGMAWSIVEAAGRPNAGVTADIAHHVRSGCDSGELLRIPGDRIWAVQLCDGPAQMPQDIVDETLYHRLLPGQGEWDVSGYLTTLAARGVYASVGCELYQRTFASRAPLDVMRELASATRRALALAGV